MKPKIAFFDTKPYDKELFSELNKDYGYDIKFFRFHLTIDNCILAKGADVVVIFVNDIITHEIIDQLHAYGVKLIALRCSGFNNVDLKAANGKIKVVRVPAYSPHAIAEHTLTLMLTLNRKVHRAYNRTREANFSLSGLMGFDMYNKTAGVIGTGKIGKVLLRILKGLSMEVLAYDPFPDEKFAHELGITYVPLEEIFSRSHIISLNCPLTSETEYLINHQTIDQMQEGVMIINTGRGKLIKTSDLIAGLKSGKIRSAGLDVYEEESDYFFEDRSDKVITDDILARLLAFNNVIVTSHQAFFTREAMMNIGQITMENIKRIAENLPLNNEVKYEKQ